MRKSNASSVDVLCLCSWHGIGGAEKNAERLALGFSDRGYSAALGFLFDREPELDHAVKDVFVVAPRAPRTPVEWVSFYSRFRTEISKRRPRVGFGFHPMANVLGATALSRSGGSFVGTQRNPEWTQSRTTAFAERLVGSTNLYRGNIAVSNSVRESYSRNGARYCGKMSVVYNDVPALAVLDLPKLECRQLLGMRSDRLILGGLGRLHEQKNFKLALEVLARVPQAELWLAGEGPQESFLRERATSLGVSDRVKFIGSVRGEKLSAFYQAIDVLLMTSIYEGHPMVMLEAMSCGTRIVANDVAVLREAGGDAVLYCADHDPEMWGAAVAWACGSGGDGMAEASRARAERFSTGTMIDEYLRIAGLPSRK